MPKTITFNRRKIGLTKENKEILVLWSALQLQHMKDNSMFIYSENEEEENTTKPNKLKGTGNWICRTANNYMGWEILDNGQQILIPEEKFTLDFESDLLLHEFQKDLIHMALKMGCNATIDSDKLHNEECAQHPFALIKEILIRMTAKAFDVSEGIKANSTNVYKVIKGFISGLSTLSIAEDKSILGDAKTSELNKVLSSNLSKWMPTIESIVSWVSEVNKTTNIIQSNMDKLYQLSDIVRQHLYCNLRYAKDGINTVNRGTLLHKDWSIALLETLEEEIITLSNTSTSTSTELANHSNVQSLNRENSICSTLENSSNAHIIINIKALYSSLRGLCSASGIVSSIGGLNREVGTMPFILKMIEVNNLSAYIQKYETLAINACEAACIEESSLIELKLKLNDCKTVDASGCNFAELAHPDFIKNATNRISSNLKTLYTLCQDAGCPDVIKWNSNFTMALPQSYESPKEIANQPKLIGNSTTQSTTIHTIHDGHPIEFEIRPKAHTKNSFFNALGLDRNIILNELLVLIKNEDTEIKPIIALEASYYFQNNPLPNELLEELTNDNKKIIRAPIASLKRLCTKLREEIVRSGDSVDQFPINDVRLLEQLTKINSPLLNAYKTDINAYNKQKASKDMLIQEITLRPEVNLAYFTSRYIEQGGDLIYQSKGCLLLNIIIEMNKIQVSIWEKNHSGGLQHCESFNQNSAQNNLSSSKHILHANESNVWGDSFFQELTVKEISFKQNKKPLKELLAKMINEDSTVISDGDKISILKHFCVADKTLADENFMARSANVERINQQLGAYEQQLNLHILFKDHGLKYVLAQTLAKTEARLLSNPSVSIDEQLMNVLEQEIALEINNYLLTGLSNSYEEIQNTNHLVGHQLKIQTKGKSYLINKSTNSSTPFVLFLQETGLCYSVNSDNTYSTFTETLIQGDGQCGFNAMGTNRDEFVITLRKAIACEDNRAILAIEILEHIKMIFTTNSQFWNRTLLTKEITSLMEKESELEEEIASIKVGLDKKLDKTLTKEQWLDYFTTHDQEADRDTNAFLKRLKNATKELDECNKSIFAHCMDQKIGNLYISIYNNANFWLGKYAAKVFAKQHDIALSIYDKPATSNDTLSPIITRDKETSYQPEKPSKSVHIVYEKGSHFNKLELNNQKIHCPNSKWQKYFDILKQELTQTCMSFQPIIGNTLDQYVKKIRNYRNITKALVTVSIADQEKIILLNNKLKEEKQVLKLKTQHDKERGDLSIPMTSYLKAYDSTCFKDLLIQVDEPLNEKNQTLLLKAVENKNIDIVKCLLDLKASGSVESETDFALKMNPNYKVKDCINTYVLKRKPNNNNQWSLKYFDSTGKKEVLEIERVTGLKEALSKSKEVNVELETDINEILFVYHDIYQKTTPLIKAAITIGFLDQVNQPLFYALLKHSVKEATPHIQEAAGPLLKELSSTFTRNLINHFEKYIKIQEERDDGVFKTWIQTSPWIQKQFISWGIDKSPQRAYQIAVLLKSLINGEKNHEYLKIIHDYQSLLTNTQEKGTGALFTGLKPIFSTTKLKLKKEDSQFQLEIDALRKSRNLKSSSTIAIQEHWQKDLVSDNEQLKREIAKLKEAQLAQLKETEKRDIEAAMQKEALKKETEKRDNEKANQDNKIAQILETQKKETQERSKKKEEKSKAKDDQQKSINSISESYTPQQGYSSPRFFENNTTAIKPKQRTSAKTLSAKYKQLLADNQWEITQESEDSCDFFTAFASEINRVKKKQGSEEITGKNLRQFCYEFYRKNTKNKNAIKKLNESLENIDADIFQIERKENYEWIRHDASTQTDQFCLIDGFCAVEGVILLAHYKLPSIFEITVDDNNQIQYAIVSSEKGYTKIIDDNCPITCIISQHIDSAPVLLIDNDNYYFISKAKVKNFTSNASNDFSASSVENSDSGWNEDWSEDSYPQFV